MKKALILLLISALVFALCFAACGNKKTLDVTVDKEAEQTQNEEPPASGEPDDALAWLTEGFSNAT